jgi:hypothetical protein
VVFAAIQLNLRISCIKQMDAAGIIDLPLPALTLRHIAARAWGKMSEEGRMDLVARFRDDLEYCDPANFEVGSMVDVRDMMFVAFQGSPSFCWHEIMTTTCCDGVNHHGKQKRLLSIQPSGVNPANTMRGQLQLRFGSEGKLFHEGTQCSNGGECAMEKT